MANRRARRIRSLQRWSEILEQSFAAAEQDGTIARRISSMSPLEGIAESLMRARDENITFTRGVERCLERRLDSPSMKRNVVHSHFNRGLR